MKTALGLPVVFRGLPRLRGAEPGPIGGLVELDLEAKQQWLDVAGGNAYLYAFNGQVPGPIVEARPGDRIRIRFRNGLSEPTNLHYHGLHIPPTGNADNSFLMIPPGESLTYEFTLPANHPAGTFWYHPHLHQSAARQVSRGLAGLFLVRGELDAIPEIASAQEYSLVLQDFDLDSRGVPREPNMMQRMQGREGDLITMNGLSSPAIPIRKDGQIRLRLLNASSSRFYRLRIEEHTFHQIASDGGALPVPLELAELLLVPGERAEVIVEGSRAPDTYRLVNLPYNRGGMGMMGGGRLPVDTLATLVYEGKAEQSVRLPERLAPVETLPPPAAVRTFVLGQGMGMGMMGGGMNFTINGRTFRADRVDTRVRLGSVEDWEFVNPATMDHPMHIHTNPFQVVNRDGSAGPAWKDVVLVRAGSRVRVRTRFQDFTGKAMYHCHILDHEDLGMMGVVEIVE
ncbi:MAG: multicopper oxidase family protein [Bryobacterales bacterium]|nr:multicopper oxidase family protein [Bryobacterales bacterium]